MTFAREALPFVLHLLLVAVVLAFAGSRTGAISAAAIALLTLMFFRVPARPENEADGLVVSAACGKVLRVETVEEPLIGPGTYQQVVTFLSVFDVHVQRSPVAGEVVGSYFHPGKKVAAFRDDAGDVNENHLVVLRLDDGRLLGIRQITGLVARRIVSYPKVGDRLRQGELIGLIKFGSRVDLLLPQDFDVSITPGDRVTEGKTLIASFSAVESGPVSNESFEGGIHE